MSVTLREIREDELPEFLDGVFRFYVDDLQRSGGFTRAEAEEKAKADHETLFPGGRSSPEHHLLAIEDDRGVTVGRVWYTDRPPNAFLYAIDLDEEFRGKGYGREAMSQLETLVRASGAEAIWLNVFAGNDVARSLYHSLGYYEASVHMSKRLA